MNQSKTENKIMSLPPTAWDQVSEGPWSKRRKHQSLIAGNKLLILGGFDGEGAFDLNDVWSYDGNSWELVTEHAGWSGRDGHSAVLFKSSIYVLGGTDDPYNCKNDVWRSDNGGYQWQQITACAPWPERWQHAACVHNGHIYIIGGWGEWYLNDIWSSPDGMNWTCECAEAPWKPRMFLSVISFKGAIYVIGGHDGRMQLRDVWASSDSGKSWIQVCQTAQWEGRQGHTTVAVDGCVYLMGGFGGANRYNDLWKSTDCAHWTCVTHHCDWTPRQGHACLSYGGSIFIMGGFDESGYCNDMHRLKVGADTVNDHLFGNTSFFTYQGHGQGLDTDENTHLKTSHKQITVSIACVLETVEILRNKRSKREKIIRDLMTTVAIVMKVVNATPKSLAEADGYCENNLYNDCSDSRGQEESKNAVTVEIENENGHRNEHINENENENEKGKKEHDAKHTASNIDNFITMPCLKSTTKNAKNYFALSKCESLYGEPLVSSGSSVACEKGMSCVKNDEDVCMHAWELQVLPKITDTKGTGTCTCTCTRQLSYKRQLSSSSLEVLCDTTAVESGELDDAEQTIAASSAALREGMEADRTLLNSIQRSIRTLAENGETGGIADKVKERTIAAVRAESLAVHLHKHVICARLTRNRKQSLLSCALVQLEELKDKVHAAEEFSLILPTDENGNKETQDSTLSKEASEDLYSEQCSLTDWEEVFRKFSEVASAIDFTATEASIQLLRDTLHEQSVLSMQISKWLELGELDLLGAPSTDSLSSIQPHDYSNENAEEGDNGEKMKTPGSTCSLSLSDQYDACTVSLDKYRMTVKIAADSEICAIGALEVETENLLLTTISKGSGLLKSLITQNRLDILEIIAMEKEMNEWMGILARLKSPLEIRAKIDRLIAENHVMEEELLLLEDTRIDIRSSLEKAALKRQRKRYLGLGTLSSSSEENIEYIDEIKENLLIAESKVKSARRMMREWYRGVREFAGGLAPELFYELPDLQAAGSLLGDGGFAKRSKLPKRRLEEYDDVRPLLNEEKNILEDNDVSTGVASMGAVAGLEKWMTEMDPGRHILLRASYNGDEVVLKGFIMGEVSQRTGLERELAILSTLRNDCVISPGAVVEDFDMLETTSYVQRVAVFVEYPYYKGGNLARWLQVRERKPWELQGIARQLLYGLLYVHDRGVTHRDIKPSNILMHEDGRAVLSDFELSRQSRSLPGEDDISASSSVRAGTKGYMAPEVESGEGAVFASDMYSFGVLLMFMHYPALASNIIPGSLRLPPSCEIELADLIQHLTAMDCTLRPTAAAALMHPYFRSTFVERLLQEGEVVEQDRKLEAVRDLLRRVKQENRNDIEKTTVKRESLSEAVLAYFQDMNLDKMRASLKIIFVGEPGVDEGGLLTEMFSIFFESVFSGEGELFVGSGDVVDASRNVLGGSNEGSMIVRSDVVLPNAADTTPHRMLRLRAFGRAMVKALYEGRRMGNRLCPSVFKFLTGTTPSMRDLQMYDPQTARSLQWTLATAGVEEFGIHFESVGEPEKGHVTDSNKAAFVRAKIDWILVKSRLPHLLAIKAGFTEALHSLSLEAAPFLSLLSHMDWRVMLCGDSAISGPQVNDSLKFLNFPKKSKIPTWLREIILSSSEDHLRQFLVFVTGSPSITPTAYQKIEINVRCQARSGSLPVAHTCFYHLDIPDYRDKEILLAKLTYAIDHANTFEIV